MTSIMSVPLASHESIESSKRLAQTYCKCTIDATQEEVRLAKLATLHDMLGLRMESEIDVMMAKQEACLCALTSDDVRSRDKMAILLLLSRQLGD